MKSGAQPVVPDSCISTSAPQQTSASKKSGCDNLPRKLEAQRRIIAAARSLFLERGYHETTTLDIARLAGVGHASFYTHFKDKTDCFIAFIHEADHESCQIIDWFSPEDGTPEEILRSWFASILSYAQAHPGILKIITSDIRVFSKNYKRRKTMLPLGKKWIALFDKWKQSGKASVEFDSLIFCYTVSGMMRTAESLISRDPATEKYIINEMVGLLLRSIGADVSKKRSAGASISDRP